jgi:hypothetical protein
MSIILQSSGGGSITIAEPATASNFTQTLPAADGVTMVSGNQPAFSAYLAGSNQSITSGVTTKVTINTEEFDTASAYDNTTNYRFTPQVAGYYQVNGQMRSAGSAITYANIFIYKNGSSWKEGTAFGFTQTAQSNCSVSTLMYLNGTTDYIELYAVVNAGAGVGFNAGQSLTWFCASLVRSA